MLGSRRRASIAGVALTVALIATGCGGDDDETTTAAAEETTTAAVEEETTTAAVEEETTTSAEETTTVAEETTAAEETTTSGAAAGANEGDGTLLIGGLFPQTGDLAFLGPPQQDAAQLAVDEINAAGGVLGQDVGFSVKDDGTNPDVAATAADELINVEGVDAIIGAAASTVTLGIIDAVTGAGIVECSPSNTGASLTDYPDNGFYFRTAPPDGLQASALANLVLEDGYTNVAVVNRNDAYGQGFADLIAPALEEGGATVTSVNVDPAATAFDAEVGEVAAAAPEAVVLIAFPQEGALIITSMIENGIGPADVQLYLTDGTQSTDLVAAVDPDDPTVLDGAKGTAPSSQGSEAFTAAFSAAYPDDDQIFSSHSYDCAVVISLAAVQAGTDAPAAIQAEMIEVTKNGTACISFAECAELIAAGEDIDYNGAAGLLDFTDAGEPGAGTYDIWQFANGEIETIGSSEIGG